MTAPIEGGRLLALPYRGPGLSLDVHSRLLDHMETHRLWFAGGGEDARVAAAWMLTNAEFYKHEIWNGGRFAGMLLLSRITPKVDALMHFTLLPAAESGVTLFGARRLLWNFIGHAFETFGLQRISAEVPEHVPKLAHFFRRRLGFKYEGEADLGRLQKNKGIVKFDIPGAPTWIAGHGSRRERAHWNGRDWSDLILLRLLRDEYLARASSGDMPKATSENTNPVSPDVPRLEASNLSAATP